MRQTVMLRRRGCFPALVLGLTVLVAVAGADDSSSASKPSAGTAEKPLTVSTDVVFEQIMQTLPAHLRARLDSAAASRSGEGQSNGGDATNGGVTPKGGDTLRRQTRDDALKRLPDKLRRQVEEAIEELDRDQQQRRIQFKEFVDKKQQ